MSDSAVLFGFVFEQSRASILDMPRVLDGLRWDKGAQGEPFFFCIVLSPFGITEKISGAFGLLNSNAP